MMNEGAFGMHTHQQFNDALQSFYEGCRRIAAEYNAKMGYTFPQGKWRLDWLEKRARVVHENSLHCFVDFQTGDVLKAAGWKAPAKHARGNIYDAHNGLKSMGPYGPAYLR